MWHLSLGKEPLCAAREASSSRGRQNRETRGREQEQREFAERKHFCWRGEEQLWKLHQSKTKNRGRTKGAPMRADKEPVLPLTAVFIGAVTYSCLLYLSPHKSLQQAAQRGLFSQNSYVFACRESLMLQLWMLLPPHFYPPSVVLFLPSPECLAHALPNWSLQPAGCFSRLGSSSRGTPLRRRLPLCPCHGRGRRATCRINSWSIKPQGASWGGGGGDD